MTTGFDLDEIERLRERLGSVSSAMMEGDNLAILLCGYFDNPDQDGSDDDCGWTPDGLAGYTEVCDAIHAHYAPTLTAMLTEIRELRAENARLLSVASSFEVQGPDADNLLWLIMRPQGTTGQAMFNLGGPSRIAGQVANIVEQDRRAALGEPQ